MDSMVVEISRDSSCGPKAMADDKKSNQHDLDGLFRRRSTVEVMERTKPEAVHIRYDMNQHLNSPVLWYVSAYRMPFYF